MPADRVPFKELKQPNRHAHPDSFYEDLLDENAITGHIIGGAVYPHFDLHIAPDRMVDIICLKTGLEIPRGYRIRKTYLVDDVIVTVKKCGDSIRVRLYNPEQNDDAFMMEGEGSSIPLMFTRIRDSTVTNKTYRTIRC